MARWTKLWNDALRIGIPEIDDQHRSLLHLMDRLSALTARENAEKEKEIREIFCDLDTYAKVHFAFEEGILLGARIPILGRHRQLHESFNLTLANLHEEYQQEGPSEDLARKIHEFLGLWFRSHINEDDRHFSTLLPDLRP